MSVPTSVPISLAAAIAGRCTRDFRHLILAPGLVQLDARRRVVTASLEAYLGFTITSDRYLQADRKLDSARQWQQRYRDAQKEKTNAVTH